MHWNKTKQQQQIIWFDHCKIELIDWLIDDDFWIVLNPFDKKKKKKPNQKKKKITDQKTKELIFFKFKTNRVATSILKNCPERSNLTLFAFSSEFVHGNTGKAKKQKTK